MLRLTLMVLVFVGGIASAADPQVTPHFAVPAAMAVNADVKGLVLLTAADGAVWTIGSEKPTCLLWPEKGGAACRISSATETSYVVIATTPSESKRWIVSFGKSIVPPVTPPVVPPVTPPSPPVNPPVNPPVPVNPLTAKLQEAFTADTGAKKADSLVNMVELFRQAQELPEAKDSTTKYLYKTTGELVNKVRNAAAALVKKDELTGMKVVINAEMKVLFPNTAKELSDDVRTESAKKFKSIHDALVGVK